MNLRSSRRTTLTLPSKSLDLAQRIARQRHLNLSAVIGEALERGLREVEQTMRSEAIVANYRKAFDGFTPDELLMLDGIYLSERIPGTQPAGKHQKRKARSQTNK